MTNILLKVTGLQVAYGGIQAVKGVSFEVHEGELVSLIGSNGAGKTTTMKAITGSLPINNGDIEYLGKSIRGQGPWDLVRQGLAMVPEGRGVFTRMNIIENLQMGAYIRDDKADILADIDKVFTIFPRLKERRSQLAGTMSGGEQQMLAMGRALMSRPKVLLLDEPSSALDAQAEAALIARLAHATRGKTLLIVTHRMSMVRLVDRIIVLDKGRILVDGPRDTVMRAMSTARQLKTKRIASGPKLISSHRAA